MGIETFLKVIFVLAAAYVVKLIFPTDEKVSSPLISVTTTAIIGAKIGGKKKAGNHPDKPTVTGELQKIAVTLLKRFRNAIQPRPSPRTSPESAASTPEPDHIVDLEDQRSPGTGSPVVRYLLLGLGGFLLPFAAAIVTGIILYAIFGQSGTATAIIVAQPVAIVLGFLVMVAVGYSLAPRDGLPIWVPVVIGLVIAQILIHGLRPGPDASPFTMLEQVGLDIGRVVLPYLGAELGAWLRSKSPGSTLPGVAPVEQTGVSRRKPRGHRPKPS